MQSNIHPLCPVTRVNSSLTNGAPALPAWMTSSRQRIPRSSFLQNRRMSGRKWSTRRCLTAATRRLAVSFLFSFYKNRNCKRQKVSCCMNEKFFLNLKPPRVPMFPQFSPPKPSSLSSILLFYSPFPSVVFTISCQRKSDEIICRLEQIWSIISTSPAGIHPLSHHRDNSSYLYRKSNDLPPSICVLPINYYPTLS